MEEGALARQLLPPYLRDAHEAEGARLLETLRAEAAACVALDDEQWASADTFPRLARLHRLIEIFTSLQYTLPDADRAELVRCLYALAFRRDLRIPLQVQLLSRAADLLAKKEHRRFLRLRLDPRPLLGLIERLFEARMVSPQPPPRCAKSHLNRLRSAALKVLRMSEVMDPVPALALAMANLDLAERCYGHEMDTYLQKAVVLMPPEHCDWSLLVPRLARLLSSRGPRAVQWDLGVLCLLRKAEGHAPPSAWDDPERVRDLFSKIRRIICVPIATAGQRHSDRASRAHLYLGHSGAAAERQATTAACSLLVHLLGRGGPAPAAEVALLPPNLLAKQADAGEMSHIYGGGSDIYEGAKGAKGAKGGSGGSGTQSGTPGERTSTGGGGGGYRPSLGTYLVCSLLQEIRPHLFPGNEGWWSERLSLLVHAVSCSACARCGHALAASALGPPPHGPPTPPIPPQELQSLCRCLLPLAHQAMYSRRFTVLFKGIEAIRALCSLCPRVVASRTLPLLHEALSPQNLTRSHQAPSALFALQLLLRPLSAPAPHLQPHLEGLLHAALPAVDPNDRLKLNGALTFAVELLAWAPVGALEPGPAPPAPAGLAPGPPADADAALCGGAFGAGWAWADCDGAAALFLPAGGPGASPGGSPPPPVELGPLLGEWAPLFLERVLEVLRSLEPRGSGGVFARNPSGMALLLLSVRLLFTRCDRSCFQDLTARLAAFLHEMAGRGHRSLSCAAARLSAALAASLCGSCGEDRSRSAVGALLGAMGAEGALGEALRRPGLRPEHETAWRLRICGAAVRRAHPAVVAERAAGLAALARAAVGYERRGAEGAKRVRKAGCKLLKAMLRAMLDVTVHMAPEATPVGAGVAWGLCGWGWGWGWGWGSKWGSKWGWGIDPWAGVDPDPPPPTPHPRASAAARGAPRRSRPRSSGASRRPSASTRPARSSPPSSSRPSRRCSPPCRARRPASSRSSAPPPSGSGPPTPPPCPPPPCPPPRGASRRCAARPPRGRGTSRRRTTRSAGPPARCATCRAAALS